MCCRWAKIVNHETCAPRTNIYMCVFSSVFHKSYWSFTNHKLRRIRAHWIQYYLFSSKNRRSVFSSSLGFRSFCFPVSQPVSQMCDHHHHNSIWFEMKWNAGAPLKMIPTATLQCVSSLWSIKVTFVYNFRIIIYWLWPYLDAVFFSLIYAYSTNFI